jgi:hypothetical protein
MPPRPASIMTMTEEARSVYLATIAGRSVKVHRLTETQAAMLGRYAVRAERATRAGALEAAVRDMANILDMLDMLIAEEDDRAWVESLMARGELEVRELLEAVRATVTPPAPATGPATVTRGRAR